MATCSPSELLASGSCFQCLTKKELQIVIAQLLCEIQSGGGGGGSGPKVYRALLYQTGTDAPVATVLENTLGVTPIWSRTVDGVYDLTATGLFPVTKTFSILASCDSGASFESFTDDLGNYVRIKSRSAGIPTDGLIYDASFEILVYP